MPAVRVVVFADGETNVSVDTIAPETVPAPQMTSVELVATTLPAQPSAATKNSPRDVVAAGLVAGAVVLSVAWWVAAARGRSKPL